MQFSWAYVVAMYLAFDKIFSGHLDTTIEEQSWKFPFFSGFCITNVLINITQIAISLGVRPLAHHPIVYSCQKQKRTWCSFVYIRTWMDCMVHSSKQNKKIDCQMKQATRSTYQNTFTFNAKVLIIWRIGWDRMPNWAHWICCIIRETFWRRYTERKTWRRERY